MLTDMIPLENSAVSLFSAPGNGENGRMDVPRPRFVTRTTIINVSERKEFSGIFTLSVYEQLLLE